MVQAQKRSFRPWVYFRTSLFFFSGFSAAAGTKEVPLPILPCCSPLYLFHPRWPPFISLPAEPMVSNFSVSLYFVRDGFPSSPTFFFEWCFLVRRSSPYKFSLCIFLSLPQRERFLLVLDMRLYVFNFAFRCLALIAYKGLSYTGMKIKKKIPILLDSFLFFRIY